MNLMSDPAALVADLAAALAAGTEPEPEAARTFSAAVSAWLEGQAASLDEALKLGGRAGLEHARSRYRRRLRDRHLKDAAALLNAAGIWSASVALAAEVERFERRLWPKWRDLPEPPPGCASINAHLWRARRINGKSLPSTPEGLRQRLTQEQACSDLGAVA